MKDMKGHEDQESSAFFFMFFTSFMIFMSIFWGCTIRPLR